MQLDHLGIPVTDPHLYIETDDAAATAAALKRSHATPWGTQELAIKDDQGHPLYFGART